MRFCRALLTIFGFGFATLAAAATEAVPVMQDIFDRTLDGETQLRAALAEAAATQRRVVLLLGANWCPWCHRMNELLTTDAEIKPRWEKDFVLVRIDVNRRGIEPRNPAFLQRYRLPSTKGIPILVVLAPTGEVLATPPVDKWEVKEPKDIDVTKLREFLAQWAPPR